MAFLPLLKLALPYVLGGLEYLRQNSLLPDAPPTTPTGEIVPPPFTGGQCLNDYFIYTDLEVFTNGSTFFFNKTSIFGRVPGRISDIKVNPNDQGEVDTIQIFRFNAQGQSVLFDTTFPPNGASWVSATNFQVEPASGGLNNCGDAPSTNTAPPIGRDGIADSPAPNLDANALKVVEGAPLAPLPNFSVAIAAALAAARAAANALDAIKSIADAVDALKDLLNKLNEDAEDKDKDGKKDIYRYEFGAIRGDGFLRFYPNVESNSYKAEQLDINILSIPIGYGKYFGEFSPNFYRFKELGYIAFVSPTFGVIEYKEIEFSRMSLRIPEDCIGFFYHLGLDDAIAGNTWAYYSQQQEE